MLLGASLAQVLHELGISRVRLDRTTFSKLRDSKTDFLQWLAVLILNNKVLICRETGSSKEIYEKHGIKLLFGKDSIPYEAAAIWYTHSSQCREDVTDEVKEKLHRISRDLCRKVMFIIDVAFWHEHTEIEKNELIEQIVLTVKTIRSYLYDFSIAITSASDEFIEYFNRATQGMQHNVTITRVGLREFLKNVFRLGLVEKPRVAVLDPEAEFKLTTVDVKSYNVYILGGIIDKERVDKFGTLRLYNLHRLWEFNIPRFKITIGDSIIGVPDRINKIVNIILAVLYEGLDIEQAIILHQSKRDRIYRWMYEIQKYSRKVVENNRVKNIVTQDFIKELQSKYPLDEKSISKVFKSLNVVVE